MEKTDNYNFYVIVKLVPVGIQYLNVNDLPIITKVTIKNSTNKEKHYCGLSVEVEDKSHIDIYDIINSGALYFTSKEEAENMVSLLNKNGYKSAFIAKINMAVTYIPLIDIDEHKTQF